MIEPKIKHIAIAGNIGAGKTTLATLLGKNFNWEVQYEEVESNPYLEDFYLDMPRWSFNLQVYFLNSRFKQIYAIQKGGETVVQDRTIYEDCEIFAPNLYNMGLMSERDYLNYRDLFQTLSTKITPPDLLIYLRASIPKLVEQIQKRGRDYEENLRLDYLKKLNELYEKWILSYSDGKLLIVDIDKFDFANNQDHLAEVINLIRGNLHGLF